MSAQISSFRDLKRRYLKPAQYDELDEQCAAIGRMLGKMSTATTTATATAIREDVLRDPRFPVHKIADRLLPYLRVLVEQFHPQQVILFGSYAYGEPSQHSDVDLLVVKEMQMSGVEEANAIVRAWRPIRKEVGTLPIELIIEDPERHEVRSRSAAGFYYEIARLGLTVA